MIGRTADVTNFYTISLNHKDMELRTYKKYNNFIFYIARTIF